MKKTLIIFIYIFLILSACTFLSPSESDIQTAIAQTLEADISLNVTPIPDVNVTDSLDATENCFPPPIPGISYESISEYLGEKGIYCNPMQRDAVSFSTICEGETKDGSAIIRVEIYSGNRPEEIYSLFAFVEQVQGFPSNDIDSEILGYIAAIPYQNSEPNKAQAWVKNNLSRVKLDSSYEPMDFIGGIRFHMSCHVEFLSCIAIGFGQSDYDCNNPPIITESFSSLSTPTANIINASTPDLHKLPTSNPVLQVTPIVLKGSGTTVVRFDKWEGPALIHIIVEQKSNKGLSIIGDYFFVGRFGHYDGIKLLDHLLPNSQTSKFEIEADGDWTIEIMPITAEYLDERLITIPGRYEGTGDDVVLIDGNDLYRAVIKGNPFSNYFGIWAYGADIYHGEEELIVNVTDEYEGTIDLPDWTRLLEVEAEGPWSIEISKR